MGLLDFLMRDEKKSKQEDSMYEEGRILGMSDEEIEDAIKSGITPEEWLEENEYENYVDQDLDKD